MKYEKILNDVYEYLESTYKNSEITMILYIYYIKKQCDNDYCFKKCIEILWDTWDFYDYNEREFYKAYLKEEYNIKVI